MPAKAPYRTKQKDELLAYIKAAPGKHHTVSEIRAHFEEAGKPIGTATIYRQLDRFAEEGCVQKYVLGDGACACYAFVEDSGDRAAHFHCKCERCGRLIHLECGELEELSEHLLSRHGFHWHAGKTVFYGICSQCRREDEARPDMPNRE